MCVCVHRYIDFDTPKRISDWCRCCLAAKTVYNPQTVFIIKTSVTRPKRIRWQSRGNIAESQEGRRKLENFSPPCCCVCPRYYIPASKPSSTTLAHFTPRAHPFQFFFFPFAFSFSTRSYLSNLSPPYKSRLCAHKGRETPFFPFNTPLNFES